METISPKEIAKLMNIPYSKVLRMLKVGVIPGLKVKKRWFVPKIEFDRFKSRNADKINKLKSDYIGMYFEGYTVKQLQARTPSDFYARNIFAEQKGFAEQTIYDAVKNGF